MKKTVFLLAFVSLIGCGSMSARAGVVAVKNNQLLVDDQPQPQLFGAEVQYFRLRGGEGRNIPREKVIALWNAALDRLVEAHANAISFYVPWDFHEYAPGKFDFDGTVDEDGDGKPDYPSRDLKTWFKMVEAHGIHHILVRPGPYINAEWGFLGFGAVPLWFHQKYPNSHMMNPEGQRTFLYGYNDPDFLRESQAWLTTVYQQVLIDHIGPGKPIDFLQLDNETNFQWQSIYNCDYSPRSISAFHDFLKTSYGSLATVNTRYGTSYQSWDDVKAPTSPEQNLAMDQDWYRYQDETIHIYLQNIRKIWENLGVHEPQVMFTLAESYNAPEHGLIPNYKYRNDPGKTGLMTVNLYPKTAPGNPDPLLNQPFKADHDVKADTSANAYYYGAPMEWSMGPEIQGGWWRGTNVAAESRQQTYLSTIGHGLKGLFVYYFNEGNNWEWDWAKKTIQPYYDTLRQDPRFKSYPDNQLPDAFWSELNKTFANKELAGWDVRSILANGGTQTPELYFDAPLDGNAQVKPAYQVFKDIGDKVVAPYGDFLGAATEMTDPVCFVKDHRTNVDSPIKGLDSLLMNSYWAGALVAYSMHTGINPRIVHWGLNPNSDFDSCKLLYYQDNGLISSDIAAMFKARIAAGATVIDFVGDGMTKAILGNRAIADACKPVPNSTVDFGASECKLDKGVLYQVNNPIYKDINSESYAQMTDIPARRSFLDSVLTEMNLVPLIHIRGGGDRVVAFARHAAGRDMLWITAKSGLLTPYEGQIQWSAAQPETTYTVTDVMSGVHMNYKGSDLIATGFSFSLAANGSTSFAITTAKH